MINTAPHLMLFMRTNPLRGRVGVGWALEIKTFRALCNVFEPNASAIWGPKKLRFLGPTPSHLPK